MFYLDKLLVKWIIMKCSKLGSIFFMGPFEGFIMYASIIALGVANAMEVRMGKKK